jgi:hypothetical protein
MLGETRRGEAVTEVLVREPEQSEEKAAHKSADPVEQDVSQGPLSAVIEQQAAHPYPDN